MTTVFYEYNKKQKKYIVFREWSEETDGENDPAFTVLQCYNDLKSAKKDYPQLQYIGMQSTQ